MIEGIILGNISIDCKDPEKQRDFYAELTGGTSAFYGIAQLLSVETGCWLSCLWDVISITCNQFGRRKTESNKSKCTSIFRLRI